MNVCIDECWKGRMDCPMDEHMHGWMYEIEPMNELMNALMESMDERIDGCMDAYISSIQNIYFYSRKVIHM